MQRNETSLHLAAKLPQLSCLIEELISKGAQLDVVDDRGKTPLTIASSNDNSLAQSLLLKHGATTTTINTSNKTMSWLSDDKVINNNLEKEMQRKSQVEKTMNNSGHDSWPDTSESEDDDENYEHPKRENIFSRSTAGSPTSMRSSGATTPITGVSGVTGVTGVSGVKPRKESFKRVSSLVDETIVEEYKADEEGQGQENDKWSPKPSTSQMQNQESEKPKMDKSMSMWLDTSSSDDSSIKDIKKLKEDKKESKNFNINVMDDIDSLLSKEVSHDNNLNFIEQIKSLLDEPEPIKPKTQPQKQPELQSQSVIEPFTSKSEKTPLEIPQNKRDDNDLKIENMKNQEEVEQEIKQSQQLHLQQPEVRRRSYAEVVAHSQSQSKTSQSQQQQQQLQHQELINELKTTFSSQQQITKGQMKNVQANGTTITNHLNNYNYNNNNNNKKSIAKGEKQHQLSPLKKNNRKKLSSHEKINNNYNNSKNIINDMNNGNSNFNDNNYNSSSNNNSFNKPSNENKSSNNNKGVKRQNSNTKSKIPLPMLSPIEKDKKFQSGTGTNEILTATTTTIDEPNFKKLKNQEPKTEQQFVIDDDEMLNQNQSAIESNELYKMITQLKIDLEKEKNEKSFISAENEVVKEQLNQLRRSHDDNLEKLELKKRLIQLEGELQQMGFSVELKLKEINGLKHEKDQLFDQLEEHFQKRNQLEIDNQNLNEQIKILNDKNESLEQILKQQKHNDDGGDVGKMKDRIDQLLSENNTLKVECEKTEKLLMEKQIEYEKERFEYQKKFLELESELKKLKLEVESSHLKTLGSTSQQQEQQFELVSSIKDLNSIIVKLDNRITVNEEQQKQKQRLFNEEMFDCARGLLDQIRLELTNFKEMLTNSVNRSHQVNGHDVGVNVNGFDSKSNEKQLIAFENRIAQLRSSLERLEDQIQSQELKLIGQTTTDLISSFTSPLRKSSSTRDLCLYSNNNYNQHNNNINMMNNKPKSWFVQTLVKLQSHALNGAPKNNFDSIAAFVSEKSKLQKQIHDLKAELGMFAESVH